MYSDRDSWVMVGCYAINDPICTFQSMIDLHSEFIQVFQNKQFSPLNLWENCPRLNVEIKV